MSSRTETEHDHAVELIEAVRFMLGLRPLPKEPKKAGLHFRGRWFESRTHAARALGITKQAISQALIAQERRRQKEIEKR